MNAENFCYWLQGWLEIQNPSQINSKQLNEIKNHLDLSLNRIPFKNVSSIGNTEGIFVCGLSDEDKEKMIYC